MKRLLLLLLLCIPSAIAQDLRPSAYLGAPGKVTVRGGKLLGSTGGVTTIAETILTPANNATTYVYIDLSSTPALTTSTSGFPISNYFPICIVTKDANGTVTSFTDSRPDSFMAGSGGIGATRTVGVTDADLQSAINNAGNGGTVIVPPGSALNLTSTITIAHALHLTIQAHINSTADPVFAITGTGGLIFECGGDGPTGKAITDAAPTITQNTSGAKIMTVGDGVTAFRGGVIQNCRFIATTNSATSTFQLNANIGDLKFRHLFISGAGFDGTAGNYTRVSFDHVRIDSAQNQAWNLQCALACVVDWNNTYANATGGAPSIGYDLGGAGGVTGSFTNCYADSNSQAYRIKGNVRLTNIETESNTGDGINIVGSGLIVIDGYRSFSDQLPVVVNATGATVLINGLRTQSTGGSNSITVAAADSIVRVNSYEQLDKAPTVSAPGKLVVTFKPGIFSTFMACSAGLEGSAGAVTDSTTATYGATITGTGANHVNAYCNGTNWVVD